MKIQAGTAILDPWGNVVKEGEKVVTFAELAMTALLAPPVDESKKLHCFKLAQKFVNGGEVEISLEEATLLKAQSGKYLSTLAHGRLVEGLEG